MALMSNARHAGSAGAAEAWTAAPRNGHTCDAGLVSPTLSARTATARVLPAATTFRCPMPNRRDPENRRRTYTARDELYLPALERARREGTTLGDIIRAALRRYVEEK